jgi:L-alanine-DL-glutamate epimerase-like enolase superfamily enzyme
MAGMATAVWIALAGGLAVVVAASAVLVARALRAWRTFRGFARATAHALEEIERQAATAEARARDSGAGAARLAGAVGRLEDSLATLAVLREAAGEAGAIAGRVRGVVPRK